MFGGKLGSNTYEPENLISQYDWDANGNLVSKQVRDLLYSYAYNEANQMVQSTEWRLEHTGNGNSKANSTNGEGIHKSNGTQEDWDLHHHDQSHLMEYRWDTKVSLSQHQKTTTFSYDNNGNLLNEQITTASGPDLGTSYQDYSHDVYGRLTQINTEFGAQVNYDYDSRDRRIKSAQSGWSDLVNKNVQKTAANYSYTSLYDGRQELSQTDSNGDLYRQLTYLPNAVAGLYGQLLKQELPQWQNAA